jgi:hypothetical protein
MPCLCGAGADAPAVGELVARPLPQLTERVRPRTGGSAMMEP